MKRFLTLTALTLPTLIGCANRSGEKAPNEVRTSSLSTGERITLQTRLNGRLDNVKEALGALQNIASLAQNGVQDGMVGNSPVDIILDIIERIEGKLPNGDRQGKKESFYSSAYIPLPTEFFYCSSLETVVEGEFEDTNGYVSVKAKTPPMCQDASEPAKELLELARLEVQGESLRLQIFNENFGRLVRDLNGTEHIPVATLCSIGLERGIVDALDCSAVTFGVGSDAWVSVTAGIEGLSRKAIAGTVQGYLYEYTTDEVENKAKLKIRFVPGQTPQVSWERFKRPEPKPSPTPVPTPSPTPAPEAPEADVEVPEAPILGGQPA